MSLLNAYPSSLSILESASFVPKASKATRGTMENREAALDTAPEYCIMAPIPGVPKWCDNGAMHPPQALVCGDRANYGPGGPACTQTPPIPAFGVPLTGFTVASQMTCKDAGCNVTVCGACSIRANTAPMVAAALTQVQHENPPFGVLPPLPVAGPGATPWIGHLARLCQECEVHEQERCNCLLLGLVGTRAFDDPLYTEQAPLNNCTCERDLGHSTEFRRCLNHKQALIGPITVKRTRNDLWLQDLDVDPHGGWLPCMADTQRIAKRRNSPYEWRACRCGKEVDSARQGEVLFCMSCNGTVHQVSPAPGGPIVSAYLPLNNRFREWTRPIKLSRDRSRFTRGRAKNVKD